MKAILTHTNADFDAIASLIALSKLEPSAIPILPARVNHNVEEFLLLYGGAFPLLAHEEFDPRDSLEQVYVVDTTGFNMVKGMYPDTPVHFIDHHRRPTTLPPHHSFQGDEVGANTTLLVEMMQDQPAPLIDALEATLMLLGIYEDTGSLSYGSTSPRDLRAAAWLLDHGADLDIMRQFLRHPLNEAQRTLFNTLAENAITLDIHHFHVTITSTVLATPIDEMSTLAHKLRDMFGCDALFMVVEVQGDVQMIARSLTDNINVGAILRELEGGGHPRAAAGRVRGRSITSVLCQLIDLLETHVRPAKRVREMMSVNVQAIQHTASIGDAHTAMLQTGHEGYPVLKDHKLVGLVTRKAVDRAMRHHMQNEAVSQILEPNFGSVTPEDSINTVRQRILQSRWGQLPVLNDKQELIGIVTRTDLIEHWDSPTSDIPAPGEFRDKLKNALPAPLWTLLETIARSASAQGEGLYLVGGIVRDLLLERPNLDIDLVVEGDAIELTRRLQKEYGGDLHMHRQFGTAKWLLDAGVAATLGLPAEALPRSIDFATARAEFYEAPTALPTVRRSSIKLDLHRRDFTINTLALRLAPPPIGGLLDFYQGREDLQNGIIRVLHSLSFVDDPTRMLRAVRFEQRFGFQMEPRTEAQLKAALPLIERVSGDRIRNELNLILAEPHALDSLERLQSLGILRAIHPQLYLTAETRRHYQTLQQVRANPPWSLPPDFDDWRIVAFSLLTYNFSAEEIEQLGRRLLASRHTVEQFQAVRRGCDLLPVVSSLPISQLVRRLEPLGQAAWLVMWIMADAPSRQRLLDFVTHWQHLKPSLSGHDLQAMGASPGPAMGEILHQLRTAWLDGLVTNADDERRYAEHLIRTNATDA